MMSKLFWNLFKKKIKIIKISPHVIQKRELINHKNVE